MNRLGWTIAAGLLLAACETDRSRPEEPPIPYPKEDYEAGCMAYERGDFVEALARFTHAIDSNPDFAPAWVQRGHTYQRIIDTGQGEHSERWYTEASIWDYTNAIKLRPEVPEPYYHRAVAYTVLQKYEKAIADLTLMTTAVAPSDPRPHLLLGIIQEEKYEGLEGDAMRHYEKYAELGGRDPLVLGRLQYLRSTGGGAVPEKPATPSATDKEDKAQALLYRMLKAMQVEDINATIEFIKLLLKDYGDTEAVRSVKKMLENTLEEYQKRRHP